MISQTAEGTHGEGVNNTNTDTAARGDTTHTDIPNTELPHNARRQRNLGSSSEDIDAEDGSVQKPKKQAYSLSSKSSSRKCWINVESINMVVKKNPNHEKGRGFYKKMVAASIKKKKTARAKYKATKTRLIKEEELGLAFTEGRFDSFNTNSVNIALELNDLTRIINRKNVSTKELAAELGPYYFMPKNPTKAMIQRVLSGRCAQVLEKPILFGLPSKQSIQVFAEGFDMTIEELLSEISTGLRVGREKRMENLDDESYDVDEDYSGDIDEDSKHDDDEQEDDLNEVEQVISLKGIQFYPFRFGLRFSYSQIAKLFFLAKGFRLPFGKSIPELPWVYLLGLVLDGQNVLNLRINHAECTFSLGGMNAIEQTKLSEARCVDNLIELYSGFSKKSDKGAMGTVTRVMDSLKVMGKAARKLSELNDTKVNLHSSAIEASRTASISASNIKAHDPMAYERYENFVTMTVSAIQPNTDLHTFRKNASKALKIQMPKTTPLMANILFPYTGTCLNFMRDVKAMYDLQLKEPTQAGEIKGKFIKYIHMSSAPETGYMAYLMAYITDRPNNKVLKLWFGSQFNAVVLYLKSIKEMPPLDRMDKAYKISLLGAGHVKVSESGQVYRGLDADDHGRLETFLGKRSAIKESTSYPVDKRGTKSIFSKDKESMNESAQTGNFHT
jgi:hypothetical protein